MDAYDVIIVGSGAGGGTLGPIFTYASLTAEAIHSDAG